MLDKNSIIPLHQQLESIIRENLDSGVWHPGELIPSENMLSRQYNISRMTVRNVISKVVQEEKLVRIAGKGTFVAKSQIIAKPLSYVGIREQLEEMGYEVETHLISIELSVVSHKIRAIFMSDYLDEQYYTIQRLRILQGQPFSVHTSYVPMSMAPNLEKADLENEQLCNVLHQQYGLVRNKTTETLESAAATANEAMLLKVKPKHPLLLLEDVISSEDGHVFEYAKVVFRGEKMKLRLQFQ